MIYNINIKFTYRLVRWEGYIQNSQVLNNIIEI